MSVEHVLAAVELPGGDDGPAFAEPWQADAFAIVVAMTDAGIFTPSEWSAALSAAIHRAQQSGDPDLGDTYYQHWVHALEELCIARGAIAKATLDERESDWRDAYESTPHGQPVELRVPPADPSGG